MAVDVIFKTFMQLNVPNEQRGSAMGSGYSDRNGPVGHVGIGSVAGKYGVSIAFLLRDYIIFNRNIDVGVTPFVRRLK
ncbi:MAG: hypothetical protein CM1200mP3_02980 [Chloroflexota bacterium]|nr:MAG: hypothetical protein CM1200mP3_02980 [Chloroflexota bacterium]